VAASPGDLTFVTTCKGRLSHLRQSLPRICAQRGTKAVVVDYGCPDGAANWVGANFPDVTLVREEREAGWSASRARNLGAAAVTTPWIMFVDADILLAEEFSARVLPTLDATSYYCVDPQTPQNWGTVICPRERFVQAGGYDEIYRGWGSEDDDLYEALEWYGAKRGGFPAELLTEVDHSDELRNRFHSVPITTAHRINQTYRRIKFDIMAIMRETIVQEERQRLYDQVRRAVALLEKGTQNEVELEMHLPPIVSKPPRDMDIMVEGVTRLSRTLRYSLARGRVIPKVRA
jgi:hypothetical protein